MKVGLYCRIKLKWLKRKKCWRRICKYINKTRKKYRNMENAMKPSIMAKEKDSEESENSSLSDASDLNYVYQRRESHPYSSGGKLLESPVKEKRATIV